MVLSLFCDPKGIHFSQNVIFGQIFPKVRIHTKLDARWSARTADPLYSNSAQLHLTKSPGRFGPTKALFDQQLAFTN